MSCILTTKPNTKHHIFVFPYVSCSGLVIRALLSQFGGRRRMTKIKRILGDLFFDLTLSSLSQPRELGPAFAGGIHTKTGGSRTAWGLDTAIQTQRLHGPVS